MEGGRGRAGTKLFQDFQMLSRIWTHPWCLQLDYISKENRVGSGEDKVKQKYIGPKLHTLQKNNNGVDRSCTTGELYVSLLQMDVSPVHNTASCDPVQALFSPPLSPTDGFLSCRVSLMKIAWKSSSPLIQKNPPWAWPQRMRGRKSKKTNPLAINFFVFLTSGQKWPVSSPSHLSCWTDLLYHSPS